MGVIFCQLSRTRPSRDVTFDIALSHSDVAFLLTHPSRDVTMINHDFVHLRLFLLTRPSRDVTFLLCCFAFCHTISTHTPLAGRDFMSS